jgi:uncharacterized FlaG/YvyC family protein
MTTRIVPQLTPKNERLPKATGIGGSALEHMRVVPLVQPNMVRTSPAVKANVEALNPMNPDTLRTGFLEKFSASVDTVNSMLASQKRFKGVRFGVHEASGRYFAVLRDSDTGKTLKQIPADAFLDIAARLKEASGLLVDIVG